MSTTEQDRGTLQEELTQVSPDGQRVIEIYEVESEDADGKTVKTMNTVTRPATLAEQAKLHADDVLRQATGMVTLANSGTVEVGGSDEAPTMTITLSAERPSATKAEPAPAPAAKSTSSRASSAS